MGKGYTEDELYKLYYNFAGHPNEKRILADFAGCPTMDYIEDLLDTFRKRYAEQHKKKEKISGETNCTI